MHTVHALDKVENGLIQKAIFILFGSMLIGIGINFFLIPNHLMNGGIIGIGLIMKYAFHVKPGLTIIFLSIPLYLFAFFRYKSYFYNGLHGMLLSSFFIDLFQPLSTLGPFSILLSALIGGLIIGTGVSLLLIVGASAGAGDLLALMIANASSLNVGLVIFIIDIIVILSGSILIRKTTMIYSFLLITIIGITTYMITKNSQIKNHR